MRFTLVTYFVYLWQPFGGSVPLAVGCGFRAVLGSGNANNGDNAGLAYFNGNNAPSNANANLSSPHYFGNLECLRQALFGCKTSAHAETYTVKQVPVGPCDSTALVRKEADRRHGDT